MRASFEDERYDSEEVAAVLASSAAMGEIIPPSIAMIVLGSITSLSISALFLAGLVPAATIAAGLMVCVYLRTRHRPQLAKPRSARIVLVTTWKAFPAFGMPLLLIGGILFGIGTPTEVSSFAVVYGVVVSIIVYRAMSARQLWRMAADTASLVGMYLFVISTASAFSWTLSIANVPQGLAQHLSEFGGGKLEFLAITLLAMIVVGALLEGLPALLIFGPLLLPIAIKLGIPPLQFGILLLVAMGIGLFTPPIGIGAYIACTAVGARLERMIRVWPVYFAALIVGLIIVALFPQLTLIVPSLMSH
jgi:tripartite ATP-independent transporter DctM subunit